ncbi:MAG: CNNM domain-containing protein, partial [Anaerolineae bacterium]
MLIIIPIVSLLIFVNAFYVAGEFSSVSARKTRIIQMAQEGSRLARLLLPVLEDDQKLDNYIAASQVGITLSSIVLGIYGEQQIA